MAEASKMDELSRTKSASVKSDSTLASIEEDPSPFPCGYKPTAGNANVPSTDAPHPILCEYCHHPAESHPPKTPSAPDEKLKDISEEPKVLSQVEQMGRIWGVTTEDPKSEPKEETKAEPVVDTKEKYSMEATGETTGKKVEPAVESKDESKVESKEGSKEPKAEKAEAKAESKQEETAGGETAASRTSRSSTADSEKKDRHKEKKREKHRDDKDKRDKGKDETKKEDKGKESKSKDEKGKHEKGSEKKTADVKETKKNITEEKEAEVLDKPVVSVPSGDQKIQEKAEASAKVDVPESNILLESAGKFLDASRKLSMGSFDDSTSSSSMDVDEDEDDSGVENAELDEEPSEPPRRFIVLRRLSNTFPFAKDCLNILDVTDMKEYDGLSSEPPMVMVTIEGVVPARLDQPPQVVPLQESIEPLYQ